MKTDAWAEISIRDLNKLSKREVRSLAAWLHSKARVLESAVELGKPWLVTRKEFSGLFRYSLMK